MGKGASSVVAVNRKARYDYMVEETLEVGISLVGTEVKALREGQANLRDSFARVEHGQIVLYNCHISPYSHGNRANHDPIRPRTLLLHRTEIERLAGQTQRRGYTLVPLKVYFSKRGLAKVELGLAMGKKGPDRRETIKRREADREIAAALHGKRG